MDGRVEVERRDDARARCAYCHDALGAEGVACPACATRLHPECVARAECPTLGCGHRFQAVVEPPRERPTRPSAWLGLFAVALPLFCLLLNEGGVARADLVPEWRGAPWAWSGQFMAPEAQRGLYPLLAWAMAAYVAAALGRRSRWIRVGLQGGVLVTGLYSVAYAQLLPVFLPLSIFLVGLLGLTPYFALATFIHAWARYRRGDRPVEKDDDRASSLAPWSAWTALGIVAVGEGLRQMELLFRALPEHPPERCFVASAAARSLVVGARPVRFGARVVPVTRQLRTLKLFELALIAFTPRLHRALRSSYDRLGPPIAARLGPVTATLAWVALLPVQALASVVLHALLRDAGRAIDDTYEAR